MATAQQVATKQDIEEVKELINRLILENAKNEHYLKKIDALDVVVNGAGQEPNGHSQKIADMDRRLTNIEDKQRLVNSIILPALSAILTIVVIAAFYNAFGKVP